MKIRCKSAIDCFIAIWVLDFALLFLLPFKSKFGNEVLCFLLSGMFVLVVIISALLFLAYFQCHKYRCGSRGTPMPLKLLKRLTVFFAVLPVVGILLILYDRIVIRGIDYSIGLRSARYQWLNSQGGSLASVTGNLLVPFSYCALFWTIFHWEKLSKKVQLIGMASGIGVPMCQALINGGRSNILIVALFTLSVLVCRYASGRTFVPKMKHAGLKIALVGIVMFIAVFSVFLSSATGISLKEYVVILINFNGAKVEQAYIQSDDNLVLDVLMLFSSYLFHGQWRFGQIVNLDMAERVGDDLMYPLLYYMKRLHLYNGELMNPPMIESNFLNLPASFYYSLGYIGLIVGGIFLGLLFGRVLYYLNDFENLSGLTVIFVIIVLMLLYSSGICNVFGFAYVIFVVYAFVATDIFIRLIWGKKSWTSVGD